MSNILDAIRAQSLELCEREEKLWEEVTEFCEEIRKNRELFLLAGGDVEDLAGLGDRLARANRHVAKSNGTTPKTVHARTAHKGGARQRWFPVGDYVNMKVVDACQRAFSARGRMNLGTLATEIFGVRPGTSKHFEARRRLSVVMAERTRSGRRVFKRTPGSRLWQNANSEKPAL